MIGGVLGMGRRMAESRMSETVTIGRVERVRPAGGFDPILTLVDIYYRGKARVKYPAASAQEKNPAGQQLAETRITVSVPTGAAAFPAGAYVRVDSSAVDDALPGRMFHVDGPAQAGQTTAHRYPVTEET